MYPRYCKRIFWNKLLFLQETEEIKQESKYNKHPREADFQECLSSLNGLTVSQCLGLPSTSLCARSFSLSFLIEKLHFLIPFSCFIGHCSLGMEVISAILFPFHSTMQYLFPIWLAHSGRGQQITHLWVLGGSHLPRLKSPITFVGGFCK